MASAPKYRIFLIEDDENMALVQRLRLERSGYEVTTCRTASDSLIVLANSHFDLVILDLKLPDMEGLALIDRFRAEQIATPVLIVTGKDDVNLATNALKLGVMDYLVKDNNMTFLYELPTRVRDAIHSHKLKEENRLFIQAMESARDGILITDLQGRIEHVNGALEQMIGFDRSEVVGKTPVLFKSGMHNKEFYKEMWQAILGRQSWQGEIINRRRDGTLIDNSLTISPMVDHCGQLTHFVGIFRDVSEQKKLERQLVQAQKMQGVGTLAGGVAHEFNNLLAGIQGYAALAIREENLPTVVTEFLQNILTLTERSSQLTRQLLTFARRPTLRRVPTRIATLLKTTADLVQHSLQIDVDLNVQDEAESDGPLLALADGNQLQQVFINLVLNARDAMNSAIRNNTNAAGLASTIPEEIILTLRSVHLSGALPGFPNSVPAGDYVAIEVQDNGVGMAPEILTQAFDPFYTTKGVGNGTGLGLPVAYGIITAHQGYMTVETAPEQGCCISMYLPRHYEKQFIDGPEAFELAEVFEPEKVSCKTIVVIDDEPAVLDVMKRFLEIPGHQVHAFYSTKEAINYLRDDYSCDLIILDFMIPKEDGAISVRKLRELRQSVPILLCTGLVEQEDKNQLTNICEQAVGVLHKPFRMNQLWYEVRKIFEEVSA